MRRILVPMLMLLLFVVGCGRGNDASPLASATGSAAATRAPTTTGSDAARNQRGYVGGDDSGVIFIQWTETDSRLTGQLQVIYVSSDKPFEPKSTNAAFTGTRNGPNVSLTFSELGTSTTWTGTVEGDKLTLVWPNQRGLLTTNVLQSGTVDDYNKAAITFRQRVEQQGAEARATQEAAATRAAQDRAVAEQQQRQQQAVRDANTALGGSLDKLKGAVDWLRNQTSNTDFERQIRDFSESLRRMQADYQQMQTSAARKQLTCSDLYGIQSDMYSIEIYDNYLALSSRMIGGYIGDVQDRIRTAEESFKRLQSAVMANQAGTPAPQYSEGDISRAVEAAIQQITLSSNTVNNAQTRAGSIKRDGAALLQAAQKLAAPLQCSR